jgi:arsenate reductase
MPYTIYHNPRCSKSRKTLQLIEAAGETPQIVRYLDDPPDANTILEIARRVGVPVRELLRRKEAEVREAANLPDLDDDRALAKWISAHPKALERPIVVDDAGAAAVVGRPPENVNALLQR